MYMWGVCMWGVCIWGVCIWGVVTCTQGISCIIFRACLKKAEELRLKQEAWLSQRTRHCVAMASSGQEMGDGEGDGEEGDDVDIDEIMNWRSKVA